MSRKFSHKNAQKAQKGFSEKSDRKPKLFLCFLCLFVAIE